MKRLLCGILSTVLCFAGVGCADSAPTTTQPEEFPCVTIQVFGGTGEAAAQRVSQAASRVTEEKLGCSVKFQFAERTDYSAELNRQRLGEDLSDILVVESKADLVEMVENGEILCLDSLLQNSSLRGEINSNELLDVMLNGSQYAVPFNNNQPTSLGFCMRADICRELNIDPTQITTMEQLHEVLLLVRDKYPDLVPVVPNYGDIPPTTVYRWETLIYDGKTSSIGVLPYDDPMPGQLELITQTEAFQDWCRTMYTWNCQGLLMEDASFNQEARVSLLGTGGAFGGFVSYNASTVLNQQINVDTELCYAVLSGAYIDSGYNDLAFGINSKTDDPDLCMRVLELLYTDVDFLRLCTLGEEGIDYEIVDGSYKAPEQTAQQYIVNLWCWPNNYKLFEQDYLQQWEDEWNDVQVSPMLGFSFDSSVCEKEANACYRLMNRYYRVLMNGETDPDVLIPQLEEQLLAAGAQTVLAEMQSQFAEWTGVT